MLDGRLNKDMLKKTLMLLLISSKSRLRQGMVSTSKGIFIVEILDIDSSTQE